MLNEFLTGGRRLTGVGVSGASSIHYESALPVDHSGYRPHRDRTPLANAVLKGLCSVVGKIVVTNSIDRDELFEQYDFKLWSYRDRLALFTLATVPSVFVLAVIYAGFQGVKGVRRVLSL